MKSSTPILDLKIQFDDIYILCGQTCSGKSTIGKYLVDKYESEIQYHEEQDIDTTFSDYEKEYLNALIEHEPEGDYED